MDIINSIKYFLNINILHIVGSISSIFALLFAFLAFKEIKNVRKKFLFKARVPSLKKSLSEIIQSITDNIRDFDNNKQTILQQIERCEVILKELKSISKKDTKKITIALCSSITDFKKKGTTIIKDDTWKLLRKFHGCIEKIKQDLSDAKWS